MTPLRQRLIDDLRLRNYSPRTIEAYVAGVVRLAAHFNRSPDQLGTEEIRAFQVALVQRGFAASHHCRHDAREGLDAAHCANGVGVLAGDRTDFECQFGGRR